MNKPSDKLVALIANLRGLNQQTLLGIGGDALLLVEDILQDVVYLEDESARLRTTWAEEQATSEEREAVAFQAGQQDAYGNLRRLSFLFKKPIKDLTPEESEQLLKGMEDGAI